MAEKYQYSGCIWRYFVADVFRDNGAQTWRARGVVLGVVVTLVGIAAVVWSLR